MPGKNGKGLLTIGGRMGGRKPDAFKVLCQQLADRGAKALLAQKIMEQPDHPAFLGALRWASENGYGKPQQSVDLTTGGEKLARFTLAMGDTPGD